MSERIEKTIQVEFNALHQPVIEPPARGKIALEVHDTDDPDVLKHVRVAGNGEALHALGTLLLGMAESAGHHVHIDEAANSEWFACTQGFTLTIENTSKPARKEQRTTDEPPPGWARG